MKDLFAFAARVAATDATVLITGETGVGKGYVAQYIHRRSARSDGPYLEVNCAAFLQELLVSELFGHTRGSVTGAVRDKRGLLERADYGTLFLDEVAEMSGRMQALLLRFFDYGEIQPIGSERSSGRVNVRVIAATNASLPGRVADGRFRHDLYYRLQVVEITVPSLRERPEDIRPLVEQLLAQYATAVELSDETWEALGRYRWPGNVRELRHVVEWVLSRVAPDLGTASRKVLIERSQLPPFVLGASSPDATCGSKTACPGL